MTETLADKQRRFVMRFSEWTSWVYAQGYALKLGEAYRTPEQAAINVQKGVGIRNSLHTQRLAIDVNLFRWDTADQWVWVQDGGAPDWKLVGEHWERMGADHAWGGRFGDANHLSITHEGRK